MRKQQAFTLLELMFTLMIAAVLLGLVAPSFLSTIRENRIATTTNDLITGLNVARSEAVRRSDRVTLCKSADPGTADDPSVPEPACTTSGGYDQGWIVFTDDNGDGDRDAGEVLIRTFQGMPDSMTATGGSNFANRIIYRADGTSTPQNGTFTLCLPHAYQRTIVINVTGRVRSSKAATVSASCS